MRFSSPGTVLLATWDYLQGRNIYSDTTQQEYALLALMAQKKASDDAKHRIFHHLVRQELQSKQQEAAEQAERRRKIHIPMRELLAKRHMYGMKTQQQVYHTQAQDVAKAFKEL